MVSVSRDGTFSALGRQPEPAGINQDVDALAPDGGGQGFLVHLVGVDPTVKPHLKGQIDVRRLITAWRTCAYSSTRFIPRPSLQSAKGLSLTGIFNPAQPGSPATSVRDYCFGVLTLGYR